MRPAPPGPRPAAATASPAPLNASQHSSGGTSVNDNRVRRRSIPGTSSTYDMRSAGSGFGAKSSVMATGDPSMRAGRCSSRSHVAEVVAIAAFRGVDHLEHQPLVRVVEAVQRARAALVAVHRLAVRLERRVHVRALEEDAPVREQPLVRRHRPAQVVVVASLGDPIGREVLAGGQRLRDQGVVGIPQRLEVPRRDPPAPREHPGHRHRARVEVVVFVPPVVGAVVTLVRLDHGDERGPDRGGIRTDAGEGRVRVVGVRVAHVACSSSGRSRSSTPVVTRRRRGQARGGEDDEHDHRQPELHVPHADVARGLHAVAVPRDEHVRRTQRADRDDEPPPRPSAQVGCEPDHQRADADDRDERCMRVDHDVERHELGSIERRVVGEVSIGEVVGPLRILERLREHEPRVLRHPARVHGRSLVAQPLDQRPQGRVVRIDRDDRRGAGRCDGCARC